MLAQKHRKGFSRFMVAMVMMMSTTTPAYALSTINKRASVRTTHNQHHNPQKKNTQQGNLGLSVMSMVKHMASTMPDLNRMTISIDEPRKGSKIPQTEDRAWVPQGLGYLPLKRWFILSSYYDRGRGSEGNASKLSAIEQDSDKHIKTVDLYQSNDKKHFGHVGGVTASSTHIYVASTQGKDNFILRYPIGNFVKAKNGDKLFPDQVYQMNHRTSYIQYEPISNQLLVGEWVSKSKRSHGELYQYPVDGLGNLIFHQVKKYRTPPDVQGIELIGNLVLYSRSTGRRNKSTLELMKLGETRLKKKWTLPSMSQGVVRTGDALAISYESGAKKYQQGGIGQQENLTIHPIEVREKS